MEPKGHSFEKLKLNEPQVCVVCEEFMKGLANHLRCLKCNTIIHKSCSQDVPACSSENSSSSFTRKSLSALTGDRRALFQSVSEVAPPDLTPELDSSKKTDLQNELKDEEKSPRKPSDTVVVWFALAKFFQLESEAWVNADGGETRVVLYYNKARHLFKLVGLSSKKKFVINEILEANFKVVNLGNLFYALSFSDDVANCAISFTSNKDATNFEAVMKRAASPHTTEKLKRTLSQFKVPSQALNRFNRLAVTCLTANFTSETCLNSDLYCQLSFGGMVRKTPVVINSNHPEWNLCLIFQHKFKFFSAEGYLTDDSPPNLGVQVFRHDILGGDECIASTEISVSELPSQNPTHKWYSLSILQPDDFLTADIQLTIQKQNTLALKAERSSKPPPTKLNIITIKSLKQTTASRNLKVGSLKINSSTRGAQNSESGPIKTSTDLPPRKTQFSQSEKGSSSKKNNPSNSSDSNIILESSKMNEGLTIIKNPSPHLPRKGSSPLYSPDLSPRGKPLELSPDHSPRLKHSPKISPEHSPRLKHSPKNSPEHSPRSNFSPELLRKPDANPPTDSSRGSSPPLSSASPSSRRFSVSDRATHNSSPDSARKGDSPRKQSPFGSPSDSPMLLSTSPPINHEVVETKKNRSMSLLSSSLPFFGKKDKKERRGSVAHTRKPSTASQLSSEEKLQMAHLVGMGDDSLYSIKVLLHQDQIEAGGKVSGEVFLFLETPIKGKSVAIVFQGLEKVFSGLKQDNLGQKGYVSKQFWFTRYTFWKATKENNQLTEPEYSWTFSFDLPKNLPPSFHYEDWLFIFYQARAYVEPLEGSADNWKVMSEPYILEILGSPYLTFVGQLQQNRITVTSKPEKNLSLSASLTQSQFALGSSIEIALEAEHHDSKPLKISLTLFQSVAIDSPKYKKKFQDTKLDVIHRTVPTGKFSNEICTITIPTYEESQALALTPSIAKPYVSYCDIKHFIKIRTHRGTFHSDAVIRLDISLVRTAQSPIKTVDTPTSPIFAPLDRPLHLTRSPLSQAHRIPSLMDSFSGDTQLRLISK